MTSLVDHLALAVRRYADESQAAARAEAEYRKQRAKRKLQARHSGEATSDAAGDTIADADDTIADLFSQRLITAAIADASKQEILSLREAIGMQRTQIASERAADQLHATDRRTI